MLIDPFQPEWQSYLHRQYDALPNGIGLILLIDSVFVPGILQRLNSECNPILLFEFLPGCSKEARDVSPFVVPFDPQDKSLARLLARCSGWPMLSALITYESAEQLAKRLAAYCIVEVKGQSFNFRFPDTRRLPTILETLTQQQRGEMTGNATGWHYIDRDGGWRCLPLEPGATSLSISNKTLLSDRQFAHLLGDSEPDEMWVRLLDRGAPAHLLPSQRHILLSNALHVADKHGLDDMLKIAWCMECIRTSCKSDIDTLRTRLKKWRKENAESEDKTSCRTA